MRVLLAFVRRAILWRAVSWVPLALAFGNLLCALLSQIYLGRLVDTGGANALGSYSGHYGLFLLMGMAALDLEGAAIAGASTGLRQAQLDGTLEALVATPVPLPLLIIGFAAPDLLWAILRVALYFVFAVLFCGLVPTAAALLSSALVLTVGLLSFIVVALLCASLVLLLRRSDPLSLLLSLGSLVAGGILYPRALLPPVIARLGAFLPVAPVTEALRAAVLDGRLTLRPLLQSLALAVVGLPVALVLLRHAFTHARRAGSLVSY